jgi:predicted transcriptional regulator of viral defense system
MKKKKYNSVKSLDEFVDDLQASGRYTFSREEAIGEWKVNALTLKKAVMRLVGKKRLAVPRRGFYAIVPAEYRSAGAPPPSWFIDDLMRHLGRPYYVGLLSAAALYSAAHQQPQEFQVMTDVPQRPMQAGRSRIRFMVKSNLERTPVREVKTETGTMRVSTPEATALDLLRYVRAAGGLNNAATVLAELAESVDGRKLVEAARADGEIAYAQRLAYILDLVGAGERTKHLERWITKLNPRNTPLKRGEPLKGCPVDRRFRVVVNFAVEADI